MVRLLFLSVTLFYVNTLSAQEKFSILEDLHNAWKSYHNNEMKPFSDKPNGETIYFSVDASRHPGQKLMVRSSREFFLFVNGELLMQKEGTLLLPLDSLAKIYLSQLVFSVYQKDLIEKDLQTYIIGTGAAGEVDIKKPDTFFRDFVIVAGLIVIVFFVAMMRAHPKLAADYFSVTRILSMRETEDNQLNARFALSSNVLFYFFSSLLLSLCLIVLFHNLPHGHTLPFRFQAFSFWGAVFQWMRMTLIIMIVFFCKILLVYALSTLFGLRGIAGIHFFNWVRLLLFIGGGLSLLLFIYYISRGYNATVYVGILTVIVVALAGWNVIAFLKLNNKNEHTMFHLFSYICATEIIPLLITIKVLFQ
jgi:hypothetical protein